jgi:hypothetical protein
MLVSICAGAYGCMMLLRSAFVGFAVSITVSLPGVAAAAQEVCHGCGCKCGPGFRLPTGHCASWAEHWRYTRKGGYPSGTVDELPIADKNAACAADEIIKKRKAQ